MKQPQIGLVTVRSGIGLISSKILRASVFAWATLVAVIISQNEAGGLATLSIHFMMIAIFAPLCTLFAALSAYILNDLSDIEIDKINSPKRSMVTEIVGKTDAVALVLMLDFGALIVSTVLGLIPLLIISLEIAGGIAYSFKPFGCKNRFILKTLSIGVAGLFSSLYGAIALGFGIDLMIVFAGSMFFFFLFATSPLNDLADKFGDQVGRRRTIPIVIGDKNTVRLSLVASIIPFLSSIGMSSYLKANIAMSIVLVLVSLRSVQLLLPLLNDSSSFSVKKSHRQMITLHFILQAAFLIGTIPLP